MRRLTAIAAAALICTSLPALAQDTAAVQSALTILGYDPGPIDGQWGGKTRTALQEFHTGRGDKFGGRLGRTDHVALFEALQERINAEFSPQDSVAIRLRSYFSSGIEVWFPSQYAFADGADRPANRNFPFAVPIPFVHDFDGDSCDDILVQFMDSNAHPYIIRGQPGSASTAKFEAELATDIPKSRAIRNAASRRDINGDGTVDFVGFTAPHGLDGTGYVPSPEHEVIIPQGADAWSTSHATYAHGGLVGDVNGDGITDIFPIDEDGKKPRHALLGDGNGGFSERFRVTALSGDFVFDAQSADLNGDGVDDFVFTTSRDYTREAQVPPSRAGENGTLAIALGEPGKSINELAFVRLGTHAMDDLHWASYRLQAAFADTGDVGYADSGTYSGPSNVDLVDFDGDGDLDILVGYFVSANSGWKTSGFRLFRNDAGQFSDVTGEVVPFQPANLFAGNKQPGEIENQATDALLGVSMIDMDGSGTRDDVLLSIQTPDVMHHDQYRASVYVNKNGRFVPVRADDDELRYTSHLMAGDFNCDGKDDLAGMGFSNESQHSVSIVLRWR